MSYTAGGSDSWSRAFRASDWGAYDWDLWGEALRWWPFAASGLALFFWWYRALLTKDRSVPAPVPKPAPLPRRVERQPGDVDVSPGLTLKLHDRYLHTLVVGTTGTGKTSRVLQPMIWQDLEAIKSGAALGITVIEPKGDLADRVAAMASELGVPCYYLDPLDPSTPKFNPFEGDADLVAQIARTVFRSLFGRQEAFWSHYQDAALVNTAKLLKALRGDDVTILDVRRVLGSVPEIRVLVERLELSSRGENPLTAYFRSEVLKDGGEAWLKHATGLRVQLESFVADEAVMRILGGRSDVSLDAHLQGGGVLIANTCAARGDAGDAFGKFLMMHFQQAVFRRADSTPHVLYIDEFPRYVNPGFATMLAMARGYSCAVVLAVQSTEQVLSRDDPGLRSALVGNCRNKILLNLEPYDAEFFSRECGEDYVEDVSVSEGRGVRSETRRVKFVPRFSPTALMELRPYEAVCLLVRDGAVQPPVLTRLELSPFDRKHPPGSLRRKASFPPPPVERRDGPEPAPPAEKPPAPEGGFLPF